MINILLDVESRFPANRDLLRDRALAVLLDHGVKTSAEVAVSVVGDRKMKHLNSKYRRIFETTDVLSFPLLDDENTPFASPPDGVLRLGDVVISYPQAIIEAASENKMVDEKLCELLEHGLLHLLGIHHE